MEDRIMMYKVEAIVKMEVLEEVKAALDAL